MQLQIRHIEDLSGENPLFEVVRMSDGKHSRRVSLTPPSEVAVGTHNTNLQRDLRWYLEEYLKTPVDIYQKRADDIQKALAEWGQSSFDALFDSGCARDWYQACRRSGQLKNLQIKIVSDTPSVLSWPWEALESKDDGFIAQQCHMERQLCKEIGDVLPPDSALPKDRLNILYIIARPRGENDVGFQTLARPLIEFAFNKDESWPVHIDLLRPPTFDQLLKVLRDKPNFYHIVHFDGHGGYGDYNASREMGIARDKFSGPSGVLSFEKEEDPKHEGELIPAEKLGRLLREHNIPIVVLNACRSAMLDEHAKDPFAYVAASLMKAGIYSVAAMSYSLYVKGAEQFVPAFYHQLFKDSSIAEAMRLGRERMYRGNMRDTSSGKVEFNDWIVPVLYQQLPSDSSILPRLKPGKKRKSVLPDEILELDGYGFIGRDRSIFQLERAIQRQSQAGILIHGMSGEGKTTLAKGFLQWLEDTNGLGEGAFWFSFEDIQSAEHIISTLAGALFGTQAMALPTDQMLSAVINVLRAKRYFIIWDNFESASGIPGTEVSALIPKEDRQRLKKLLRELRGGKTKVLITSRSEEEWLDIQECFKLPLSGLEGEELWQYCNAVVADLGLEAIDRKNQDYHNLLNKLEGNPLAVRAILLRLKERSAASLLSELEESFNGVEGDESTKRIQAALAVFERGLDRAFAPVLRLLGLHEHFAYAGFIKIMLKQTEPDAAAHISNCFEALCGAGLCQPVGNNIYKLHPALRGSLTRLYTAAEADMRAFVDVMGTIANDYAPKELHEQRFVFSTFGACFQRALSLSQELDMRNHVLALIQGLAVYALNTRNFTEAEKLYRKYAEAAQDYTDMKGEANAYHQLGIIAEEQRDFKAAEGWYRKSLAIKLRYGDEHGAAITYGQLGNLKLEQQDFDAAESWYKKALMIFIKQGNEHDAAGTYHQLGRIAEEQRDFKAAEGWYRKSLKIKLKQGNEHGAAGTYHQLGRIAEEQRDFNAAKGWYIKSLEIELKQGNEHGAASTYHQLGMIAQKQRDFEAAEGWYKKSLKIKLKQGDEHGAAGTYHQLGMIAQEQRDFEAAECWYRKSLEIKLRYGDEHGTAITYHQLGNIAYEQRDFEAAEDWYRKSLEINLRYGNEHGAAITYHQLGNIAYEQRDFEAAEGWYKKALAIFERMNDTYSLEIARSNLAKLQTLKGDNK